MACLKKVQCPLFKTLKNLDLAGPAGLTDMQSELHRLADLRLATAKQLDILTYY